MRNDTEWLFIYPTILINLWLILESPFWNLFRLKLGNSQYFSFLNSQINRQSLRLLESIMIILAFYFCCCVVLDFVFVSVGSILRCLSVCFCCLAFVFYKQVVFQLVCRLVYFYRHWQYVRIFHNNNIAIIFV